MRSITSAVFIVLCLIFPLSCTDQPANDNRAQLIPPPGSQYYYMAIQFPTEQQWTSRAIPGTRAPFNTVEGLCLNAEYFVTHDPARRGTGMVCVSDRSNRGVGEDFIIVTIQAKFDRNNQFLAQLDCTLRTSTNTEDRLTRYFNPHFFICAPELKGTRTVSASGQFIQSCDQSNITVSYAQFTIETTPAGIGDTLPIPEGCCSKGCKCPFQGTGYNTDRYVQIIDARCDPLPSN